MARLVVAATVVAIVVAAWTAAAATAPRTPLVEGALPTLPDAPRAKPNADNDAGSGTDAGGARDVALELPGDGSFTGRLRPPGDAADWYTLAPMDAAGPTCVGARTSAPLHGDFDFVVSDGGVERAYAHDVGPRDASLVAGVATAEPERAWLGFSPAPTPSGAKTPARPQEYAFSMETRVAAATDGDAGSGGDADDAEGLPVAGPCVVGQLARTSGDAADAYALSVVAGDVVRLTFAQYGVNVSAVGEVLDAAGQVVALLQAGSVVTVVAERTETWTLVVGSEDAEASPPSQDGGLLPLVLPMTYTESGEMTRADALYAIGIAVDPDPYTCRPTC